MEQTLAPGDWAVIACHLTLSMAVGLYVGKPSAPSSTAANAHAGPATSQKARDEAQYFLAGRTQRGCTIALSLLSGIKSGISFLGQPGYSYQDGAAMTVGYFVAMCFSAPIAVCSAPLLLSRSMVPPKS